MKVLRLIFVFFSILFRIGFSDTLIYWWPEQRLTYDDEEQMHSKVWAYDSIIHITLNYDFLSIYLRSTDYGIRWSDTVWLHDTSTANRQVLVQQDSVVYFAISEYRGGPPYFEEVDTIYAFFRKSYDYGATVGPSVFLGKGFDLSIDAQQETVFIAAGVGDPPPGRGAYLFRSFDGGTTWSSYLPILDSTFCCDIAYRNGVLHFAGMRTTFRINRIIYTRSTDLGTTWSPPIIISSPISALPKMPNLALGPDQDVYVAWTDNKYSGSMLFDDVMFRKSTDNGLSFGPEQRLTPDSKCEAAGALDMVTEDSAIYLVWCYNGLGNPSPCSLFFLASTDRGENWWPRDWVSGGNHAICDADIAVSKGLVYVVWIDSRIPHCELYLRRGSRSPYVVEETNIIISDFICPSFVRDFVELSFGQISPEKLTIYGITGREVISKVIRGAKRLRINVRNLPSGIYFLMVQREEKRWIRKVVKIE